MFFNQKIREFRNLNRNLYLTKVSNQKIGMLNDTRSSSISISFDQTETRIWHLTGKEMDDPRTKGQKIQKYTLVI